MIELYTCEDTCEDNAKNSYPGDGSLVMERSPKLQSKNASSQNAPNHFSRHTLAAIESIQWISQTERNFIICHSHGSGPYLAMKNFQIYLLPLDLPNDDRQKMNFSVCKPSGTLQLEKFTILALGRNLPRLLDAFSEMQGNSNLSNIWKSSGNRRDLLVMKFAITKLDGLWVHRKMLEAYCQTDNVSWRRLLGFKR